MKLVFKEECHKFEPRLICNWIESLYREFLKSNLHEINKFIYGQDILSNDFTLVLTSFELAIHVFRILPFQDSISLEFGLNSLKILKDFAGEYPKKFFHVKF